MKHFIHLIADYGTGDPAFGEVVQRLRHLKSDIEVYPTAVPAFSTMATGFWTSQYALNPRPDNFIIYTNTAPRKDSKQKRLANEGEKLTYAKLDNGCEIVGVNAGYCFSFIKEHIKEARLVNIPNKGSQFRSRDFYPEAVVGILNNEHKKYLGDTISIDIIPEVPKNKLCFVDGYGNLKTTIRQKEVGYESGQKVKIALNGVKRMAYYANGNFEVKEGELAFAPGSSGTPGNRYLEIFLRGGSAYDYFENPRVENPIKFEELNVGN